MKNILSVPALEFLVLSKHPQSIQWQKFVENFNSFI